MKILFKLSTYIVILQCVTSRNSVLSLIYDDEGGWDSSGDEIDHSQTTRGLHSPLPYKFCDRGKFRFDWMRQTNSFECNSKKKSINHSYYDNDDDLDEYHRYRHQGHRPRPRVAGGFMPQLGEFPSFVQVIHNGEHENEQMFCGGVLITAYLVLTAAHCVNSTWGIVYAGSVELGGGKSSEIIQACRPNEFINGPRGTMYDWTILELKDEFRFDDNIQPGCINLDFKLKDDYTCVSVGHGAVDNTHGFSDQLKAATLQKCQSSSPSGVMCMEKAPNVDGNGQTCSGDSGGPLYCFDNCSNKPQMFVVGITRGNPLRAGATTNCSVNDIVYYVSMSRHRLSIASLMHRMIGGRNKRKRIDEKHRLALLGPDDPVIKLSGFKCVKYGQS